MDSHTVILTGQTDTHHHQQQRHQMHHEKVVQCAAGKQRKKQDSSRSSMSGKSYSNGRVAGLARSSISTSK
jgi:hypothetical protein